jgi:hypothetical protein
VHWHTQRQPVVGSHTGGPPPEDELELELEQHELELELELELDELLEL